MQTVIVRAGAEVFKALPDCRILHAGNPEPLHGLFAARQLIDVAENQFALPSRVTGVYHLGHIRGAQQLFENIKLFLLVPPHAHFPVRGQDRQIVIAPLGVLRVVAVRVGKPRQMPHAPADPPAVPFQIPVLAGIGPDYSGQALGHRRFFSNHKAHNLHPPILPA